MEGIGAVAFIAAGIKWLSPADIHCIVGPMVRPFLRAEIAQLEAVTILENLKKPVCSYPLPLASRDITRTNEGVC